MEGQRELSVDIKEAIRIVKASGKISLEGFSLSPGKHPAQLKSHEKSSFKDIVTEYDEKVEAFLIEQLGKSFAGVAILGEEATFKQNLKNIDDTFFAEEYVWVLDPIDGTTNYSRSYPYYCTTISLLKKSSGRFAPILGVTFDPVKNEMFHALKGGGAFMNGDRIAVSQIPEIQQGLFVTGFASERSIQKDKIFERFVNITRKSLGVRRSGAAALDLAYVAIGRLDAYWECGLSSWDVAAGSLLVSESGGKVSHYERKTDWTVWSGEILASNGILHDTICSELI